MTTQSGHKHLVKYLVKCTDQHLCECSVRKCFNLHPSNQLYTLSICHTSDPPYIRVLSKMFERVIARQSLLDTFWTTSTGQPIERDTRGTLPRGEPTALILLDLSVVFNTIDHSTLLGCLQRWFGVWGSVLKWFTLFLTAQGEALKIYLFSLYKDRLIQLFFNIIVLTFKFFVVKILGEEHCFSCFWGDKKSPCVMMKT